MKADRFKDLIKPAFKDDTQTHDTGKETLKYSNKARKVSTKAVKFTAKKSFRLIKTLRTLLVRHLSGKLLLYIIAGFLFINLFSSLTSSSMLLTIPTEKKTVDSYKSEMEKIEEEFRKKIESYKTPDYKHHEVVYIGEYGNQNISWKEILCYMAVEFTQDLKCSDEEKKALRNIFNKLTEIKTREESKKTQIPTNKKDKNGNTILETKSAKVLIIEVHSHSFDEIIDTLHWSNDEKEWFYALLETDINELLPDIDLDDNVYSFNEVNNILNNLDTSNITRKNVVKVALSLVGRVQYFWGGKSKAGMNPEWGKIKLVTAPGSTRSTGKYMPYGMDCSGYTSWVYLTAGHKKHIGIGTSAQIKNSYAISKSELKPGDLCFKRLNSAGGINHVGIFVKKENGKYYFVHCASGQGVVLNNYNNFKYFRRLFIKYEDD